MFQGMKPKGLVASRHFQWRTILFTLLLSCFFFNPVSLLAQVSAEYQFSSLLALPLEELIEIRVVGTQADSFERDGIFIVNQQTLTRTLHKTKHSLAEHSQLTKQNPFLLAIDGHDISHCKNINDLLRYLRILKEQTIRIEIYQGESAHWWGGGSNLVYNIITKSKDSSAIPHSTEIQKEVATS